MEELKTTMVDMESKWQFPFAFSAIDGSNLSIKCPKGGSYESRETIQQFKNFLLYITTGPSFTWVSVGAPGDTALLG